MAYDFTQDLIFEVWDYITPEEYKNATGKTKNKTPYKERFAKLKEIVAYKGNYQLVAIESHEVATVKDAFEKVVAWMQDGLEGGVLKDMHGIYADGTSKHQLKMKKVFSLEVRITGFTAGKIGSKREKTFGSIEYSTDDGKIFGSVSGFSDKILEEMNNNREKYIGKIIEVEGNDLTRGRNNEHYAISHPRFIAVRDDRETTDDLSRALESLDSATNF